MCVCLFQVCVGAAGLYSTQYAGAAKIAPAVLFGALGGVAAVWAAALATFMLSIEPRYVPRCREYSEYPMPRGASRRYRRTFVSMETSSAYAAVKSIYL